MDKHMEKMKKLGIEFYRAEESESSKFIMIPKQFYSCPFYRYFLTATTRELYAWLVDRMSLSEKTTKEGNKSFVDENGYIYLVFTRAEIMETLSISKQTCSNAFKILNDLGLIYEKRQGQGKNNLIYIGKLKYMNEKQALEMIKLVEHQVVESKSEKSKKQTSKKSNIQKSKNQTSRSLKNRPQEVQNLDCNYTDTNYTDTNYTDTSSSNVKQRIFKTFQENICELKETTFKKFIGVVKQYDVSFLEAVIEECTYTNVKSYKGFEVSLKNYVDAKCSTSEEVHKYAKEFSKNNKRKFSKASTNINNKKDLKFKNFQERNYTEEDYKFLEIQYGQGDIITINRDKLNIFKIQYDNYIQKNKRHNDIENKQSISLIEENKNENNPVYKDLLEAIKQ